ncbi:integrase [Pediococcus ethanolidurans]|uniref:Integrase n=1 Tax=Pediococcus ethanolidurans TaxID=319653 RepID=A0A0R2K4F3_9LACO|nr:integrase [Pediococcus ethanolidurans]GEN96123.1 transposase [Pediococcus ethanolidurans]
MTPTEEHKYQIIKAVVAKRKTIKRAAVELQLTERHVRRLKQAYLLNGKQVFQHGNHRLKTHQKFDIKCKNKIVMLYEKKYKNFNVAHFVEFLNQQEKLTVSYATVSKLLKDRHVLTPKMHRATRRKMKRELEAKEHQNKLLTKREVATLTEVIETAPLKAHPSRPRKKYMGELLQMDASEELWFGNRKTHLHIAVDDCTGAILGAYFDAQETLQGYYQVFSQVLRNYGIPVKILTDRRTVFDYKRKVHPTQPDTLTNFGYACHNLGVQLATTSIPQAKGRVERQFETLQSRLINEMSLAHINDMKRANQFLITFCEEYNRRFALRIKDTMNVFEKQMKPAELELLLTVMVERVVDHGHGIKFENQHWSLHNNHQQVMLAPNTKVEVIKTMSGKHYATIGDQVLRMEVIKAHQEQSPELDNPVTVKKSKARIPAANHPWRGAIRKKYENGNKELAYAIMHG